MRFEMLFGLRMLLGRGKKFFLPPMTLIAVCGIAFGMSSALVSLSVMSGFEKAYEHAILDFNSHIILAGDGEIGNVDEVKSVLGRFVVTDKEREYWKKHQLQWRWLRHLRFFSDRRMEDLSGRGVTAMTPFVFREGLGVLPNEVTSVVIKGVDAREMKKVYPLRYREIVSSGGKADSGPFADPSVLLAPEHSSGNSAPPVLVGSALFAKFFPKGPSSGQPLVRILVPKGNGVAKNLEGLSQTFRVAGTFESGLYEFDAQFIVTSLDVMEDVFHTGKSLSGIEIVLDDRNKAGIVARNLEKALPDSFQAISWDELNESLFSAMKMEKTLFLAIMLLVILIASFNVMGVILMLILNHKHDIAVLRALGSTRKPLERAFAVNGLLLGTAGIIFGAVISIVCLLSLEHTRWFALEPEIYFVSHLPVDWPFSVWLFLAVTAMAICYWISRLASGSLVKDASITQMLR